MVSLDRAEQLEKQNEEFEKWKNKFIKSKDGAEALDELKGLDVEDVDIDEEECLKEMVLRQCFLAATYDEDRDKSKSQRRDLTAALTPKSLQSQISAAKKISDFTKDNPEISKTIFSKYKLKSNNAHSLQRLYCRGEKISDLFEQLLLFYSESLPNIKSDLNPKRMIFQYRIGALLYPVSLREQTQRPENISFTSLAFALEKIFREFSLGWPDSFSERQFEIASKQKGVKIGNTLDPSVEEIELDCSHVDKKLKRGNPSYKLVAQFSNATLGLTPPTDEIKVKSMVGGYKNKGVLPTPWPHEQGGF